MISCEIFGLTLSLSAPSLSEYKLKIYPYKEKYKETLGTFIDLNDKI